MLNRVASMFFFKDRYGGEYKNWAGIWDMINIRGSILGEKKMHRI